MAVLELEDSFGIGLEKLYQDGDLQDVIYAPIKNPESYPHNCLEYAAFSLSKGEEKDFSSEVVLNLVEYSKSLDNVDNVPKQVEEEAKELYSDVTSSLDIEDAYMSREEAIFNFGLVSFFNCRVTCACVCCICM